MNLVRQDSIGKVKNANHSRNSSHSISKPKNESNQKKSSFNKRSKKLLLILSEDIVGRFNDDELMSNDNDDTLEFDEF